MEPPRKKQKTLDSYFICRPKPLTEFQKRQDWIERSIALYANPCYFGTVASRAEDEEQWGIWLGMFVAPGTKLVEQAIIRQTSRRMIKVLLERFLPLVDDPYSRLLSITLYNVDLLKVELVIDVSPRILDAGDLLESQYAGLWHDLERYMLNKARCTFLMGLHARAGACSSIFRVSKDTCYERQVMGIILRM